MSKVDVFDVFVKLVSSDTITIQVYNDMSIRDFRKKIKDKIGSQFETVYLTTRGKPVIGDDLKIHDFGIQSESTIFALPRLKGGK
jgi:hypothetical protein